MKGALMRDQLARGGRTTRRWGAGVAAASLALAIVAAIPHAVRAATYTVSPTGNDAGSGLAGAPWRTIQKAANSASAGDTVLIAGGTYAEKVNITRSGTPGNPIVFRNADATPVLINGAGLSAGLYSSLVDISGASYVQLSGLAVRNYAYWCMTITGASTNIDLTGLDVSGCTQSGIWIETSGSAPNFIKVRQSTVHDNQAGGITVWRSPGGYLLIEGNEVYGNAGVGNYDGIQVGGGDAATHHAVVRANRSYGNGQGATGADQIDLGGHAAGDFYLVEDNQAWGPGGAMKVQQTYGATTLIARRNRLSGIGFEVYGFPTPAVYYHNTIVGSAGHALQFWDDQADAPPGRSLGGFEFKHRTEPYRLPYDGVRPRCREKYRCSCY
jgi:hypothetical protein